MLRSGEQVKQNGLRSARGGKVLLAAQLNVGADDGCPCFRVLIDGPQLQQARIQPVDPDFRFQIAPNRLRPLDRKSQAIFIASPGQSASSFRPLIAARILCSEAIRSAEKLLPTKPLAVQLPSIEMDDPDAVEAKRH